MHFFNEANIIIFKHSCDVIPVFRSFGRSKPLILANGFEIEPYKSKFDGCEDSCVIKTVSRPTYNTQAFPEFHSQYVLSFLLSKLFLCLLLFQYWTLFVGIPFKLRQVMSTNIVLKKNINASVSPKTLS